MGNQVLISGAAKAAPKFLDIGGVVGQAANKAAEFFIQQRAEEEAEIRRQKGKVETYLNQMPAGIELSKIPPAQQPGIEAWSKGMKMEYAEAAKGIAQFDVGSEEYIDAMGTMTRVKQAFVNLDNNLETFKANKTEYLKSSSEGALSSGNDTSEGGMLASVYTDEANMGFDGNGNLSFVGGDGTATGLNDIPDFFNKDFKSADALINMNSSIYNSGQKLDGPTSNMYRQKVLNMVKKGGRETLLSLATDDLIQQGGLGIVDQDLLYNPERHTELEAAVVENYMNILTNSATTGYNKKHAASVAAQKKTNGGSDNYKYGQATRDDLQIYSKPAKTTYDDLSAKLKDLDDKGYNDPIEAKMRIINDVLSNANGEFIPLVIDDGEILTRQGEYDVPLDISTDDKMIDFIVNNIGGSIGEDAKMVLKQQLKGSGGNTKTSTKTRGDASIL